MRGSRSNPWRWLTDERLTYALKVLMVLVLAFYAGQFVVEILVKIKAVVYILIGSVFLAYLIYPAVHRLRRYVPLVAAIVLVYAGILVGIGLVAVFVVPHVMEDIGLLVSRYPDLLTRLHSLLYDPNDPWVARMPAWMRYEVMNAPTEIAGWLKLRGLQTFGHVIVVLAGTLAVVAVFIIVPMVTAYLLLDLEHLKRILAAVVPPERRHATLALLGEFDGVIGGFIRGQLLVALVVGVLITFAMMLLHVPYPYLFGLLAALGDLIPYVGAVLAFLPAFLSSVLANGWINALLVTVAFVAIYQAEGHLIAPPVVGRQVRLSPFVVIVALLIGGELGGLFGLLIAVPVAGVVRVIAVRVLEAAKTKDGAS